MKASRNDPCPCGSGAKYKRCCLEKDEAEQAKRLAEEQARATPLPAELTEEEEAIEDELDADATLAAAADHPFDEDQTPWALAKFAETHPTFAKHRARDEKWLNTPALPSEVRRLADKDLRDRLLALGVDASKPAFLAAARATFEKGSSSGFAVAKEWRAASSRTFTRAERDFLGLAACELWRRYWPEEPSREMLEDAIEEGYDHLDHERPERALELWRGALDEILSRVPAGARSLAEVPTAGDALFLGEWLEDWLDELHAEGQEDPATALRGLKLTEEILARLPEQGGPGGGTTRAAHVMFQLFLGRDDEGLAEARKMRDDHPGHAIGAIALADALVFLSERDPERLAEARDVLWAAKSRVSDAKTWDLEKRHREVLKLLRRSRAGS